MNSPDPFLRPGPEHTAAPFWFWNGDMAPAVMLEQIDAMHAMGIGALVIHARVGLEIPYLSDTWFERVRLTLDACAERGMRVWLYDEDNWPSGYAGGRVLARDPDHVGWNLGVERHLLEPGERFEVTLPDDDHTVAVLLAPLASSEARPSDPLRFQRPAAARVPDWRDPTAFEHVLVDEDARRIEPTGTSLCVDAPDDGRRWLVAVARRAPTTWIAAYSDQPYVDLLNPAAVQTFIEETHEAYLRRFPERFADGTVLGFFVDEPGFYNNFRTTNPATLPWTGDLADAFRERHGYDLEGELLALWYDQGARSDRVRHDYWSTVGALLEERFFGSLARWCEDHGVALTGHLHLEEWQWTMTRNSVSPFMALRQMQVPGVDKIDESVLKVSEKLASSVAHAYGRPRVISETFALAGWKLAPPQMKQIVDHQYVRGVNWLSPHAFYYSTDDWRKRECPPSEFVQNPWWDHARPVWDYVARLSAALSEGEHVAPVALYYPSEQAWVGMTPEAPGSFTGSIWQPWQLIDPDHPLQRNDAELVAITSALTDERWDFDFVDADLLADAEMTEHDATASSGEAMLRAGTERFRVVVVPPTLALEARTASALLRFLDAGGRVVLMGAPGRIVAGEAPERWTRLVERAGQVRRARWLEAGGGALGVVPEGVTPLARLLGEALRSDVEVLAVQGERSASTWRERREMRRGGTLATRFERPEQALHVLRRRVGAQDRYFLAHEGDETLRVTLSLALTPNEGPQDAQAWVCDTGGRHPQPARIEGDRATVELDLEPWASRLLVFGPGNELPDAHGTDPRWRTDAETIATLSDWQLDLDGERFAGALRPWGELGAPFVSGVGRYTTSVDVPDVPAGARLLLDLGEVRETARVSVGTIDLPPLAWSPYVWDVTDVLGPGRTDLTVEVANTNTNAWERVERASGLLGPVRLRVARPDDA